MNISAKSVLASFFICFPTQVSHDEDMQIMNFLTYMFNLCYIRMNYMS